MEEGFLRDALAGAATEPGSLLLVDQYGRERWLPHGPFAAKLLAEPATNEWRGRTVRFLQAASEAKAWRAADYGWPALGG